MTATTAYEYMGHLQGSKQYLSRADLERDVPQIPGYEYVGLVTCCGGEGGKDAPTGSWHPPGRTFAWRLGPAFMTLGAVTAKLSIAFEEGRSLSIEARYRKLDALEMLAKIKEVA